MSKKENDTAGSSESYFRRIYDLTWNDLAAYVISHIGNADEAGDVIQTVYLSFWKRVGKHGFIPDGECLPYLKTAAKHEIGRHFIQFECPTVGFDEAFSDDGTEGDGMISDGIEDECCDRETCAEIWNDLRRGDQLTYRIFILRYKLGFSVAEAAEKLGISRAAAANRVVRTAAGLRKKYRGPGGC